ncbi:hypothetical protein KEM54_001565, partial [Ascosphaera aggregata]
MAPSFNELIDYLLNEISLCGDFGRFLVISSALKDDEMGQAVLGPHKQPSEVNATQKIMFFLFGCATGRTLHCTQSLWLLTIVWLGASPFDICRFIKEFYDEVSSCVPADAAQESAQDAVREVMDSHHSPSSMRQLVDRAFLETVWTWLTGNPEVSVGRRREGNNLTLSEVEATHKDKGDVSARSSFLRQSPRKSLTAETRDDEQPNSSTTENSNAVSDYTEGSHVFVSTSRMWLAVAGHERDDARLPPLEFALLSIIAMHKGKGIAQPELTRLSGQDKRSVPKRTDKLAQKGYIEKKAVHFKSTRTSLCTLQRFAGITEADTDEHDHSLYDFKAILDKLFSILKECQVITRDDLKEAMGMTDRKSRKILMRALKKLERIGCLERVKAVSQYSDILKSKHLSIRFIREPTKEDSRLFFEDSRALVDFLSRGEDEGEGDKDGEEETEGSTPQWTPDRPFYNQLYLLIEESGTRGMTNLEIVKSSVGIFYRRPIEATMNRLVEAWPSAQPLHLRKFVIVRDSALHGTISHYVHYTFENFMKLLDEGKVSKDALEQVFPAPNQRKKESRIAPLDAVAELDQYGFPRNERPTGLCRNGNASLRECLEVVKPVPTPITKWQPQIVRRPDGTREVVLDQAHHATIRRGRDIIGHEDSLRASIAELEGAAEGSSTAQKRKVPDDEEEGTARLSPAQKRARRLDLGEERSEKERLEALGMDMTWTEYAVLAIPRPTAGAYLTPFGKKRPTGHARGRPRKSRILIVKSEKLREFEWFTNELSHTSPLPQETDDTTAPEESLQAQKGETDQSDNYHRGHSTRKRKRTHNEEPIGDVGEKTGTGEEQAQDQDVEQPDELRSKRGKHHPDEDLRRPIEIANSSIQKLSEASTALAGVNIDDSTVVSHIPMEKALDKSNDQLPSDPQQKGVPDQR